MGDIKDIISAIEARLVALGFKTTEEVFDFESISDSVIDKSFRIETAVIENPYHLGNIANPKEEISIWIAYKTMRKPRTTWKAALDDRESVEKDLINSSSITGLSCDPILMMDREATTQKFLEDYLISKLVFTADYLRDISPV